MDNSIPVLAYAFIGLTSLVLAYVTFMDTDDKTPTPASSNSILSTVTNSVVPEAEAKAVSPVMAQATTTTGGKRKSMKRSKHSRKNKNSKKTKMNRK